MSQKKFYYTLLPILDHQGNKITEVARPIIEIVINYKHGEMVGPLKALLDSGADNNLFPVVVGSALGINISKGRKFSTFGISGQEIIVFRHYGIKIFIDGSAIATYVDFSYDYGDIPILGQQGFFDKVKSIKFVRPEEEFLIDLK
ncbi:hypothetical protein HYU92_02405 [Candidatus Curtissbacteria bacterium]|nr:hypothetical protein [Candidatus Curtissbacteria bacterium]